MCNATMQENLLQNRWNYGILTSNPMFLHFLILAMPSGKWLTNYFVNSEAESCQKLENNVWNLLNGQVWLCSVSTSTSNYVTTSRLSLAFTMLGSKNMSFLWCHSLFNKNLSTKGVHPLVAFIARQEEQISRAAFSCWKSVTLSYELTMKYP